MLTTIFTHVTKVWNAALTPGNSFVSLPRGSQSPHPHPHPSPQETTFLISVPIGEFLPLLGLHINGILFTFVTVFCSMPCFLRFIYAVMGIYSLFFLLSNSIEMYEYSTNCLSILPQITPIFAINLVSTMNIHIRVFTWTYIFTSLGWIPENGIARAQGRFMFNFTRH